MIPIVRLPGALSLGLIPLVATMTVALVPEAWINLSSQPSSPRPFTKMTFASASFLASVVMVYRRECHRSRERAY
jgi:hypothetical protein